MKYLMCVLLALSLTGCASSNSNGEPCIGAFDDPKPGVTYKVSSRNLAIGIIFFEMVFPPVVVIVNEFKCPVEK